VPEAVDSRKELNLKIRITKKATPTKWKDLPHGTVVHLWGSLAMVVECAVIVRPSECPTRKAVISMTSSRTSAYADELDRHGSEPVVAGRFDGITQKVVPTTIPTTPSPYPTNFTFSLRDVYGLPHGTILRAHCDKDDDWGLVVTHLGLVYFKDDGSGSNVRWVRGTLKESLDCYRYVVDLNTTITIIFTI
jgi:hypothetical protein